MAKKSNKANKRNRIQREADLSFVAKRRARGETQTAITATLNAERPYNLSRQQIAADLRKAEAIWRGRAIKDINYWLNRELASFDLEESELWTEWEKSKEMQTTETIVDTADKLDCSGGHHRGVVKSGGYGDIRIMQAIFKIGERRRELLGLYPAPDAGVAPVTAT